MPDYILLMHDDARSPIDAADWQPYLDGLRAADVLRGGSAIADGACFRREAPAPALTAHLVGFIRIEADTLDAVARHLAGNPVYEAGGTVEVRVLPKTN